MRILVLSPHTDDIEVGCGGSLTKWIEEGHNLLIVVFSLCIASIPEKFDKDITRREFKASMAGLGSDYEIYDFPVRYFPKYRQEILETLITIKKRFNPDLVVGTSLNDIHQDHQTIAEEMQRAFRCSILSYEMPYTTMKFDIRFYNTLERKHLDNKFSLMKNYISQLFKGKHSTNFESIEALAKMRGAQIEKEYAEGFEVIRWLS